MVGTDRTRLLSPLKKCCMDPGVHRPSKFTALKGEDEDGDVSVEVFLLHIAWIKGDGP